MPFTPVQDESFNLDLTYITPQIIAMGLPSEGIEAAYRNPIGQVSRYFEEVMKPLEHMSQKNGPANHSFIHIYDIL